MARGNSGKQDTLRVRIAHLAARIMAEDGVDDFGYAKRKAAKQAGALDARAMPDNEEIEQALAMYRQIYQQQEHASVLAHLRKQALNVMRMLERFNPHLTGSVLSGVAGKYSDIDVQLFADSTKDVEIYLLNQGIRYRGSQVKLHLNRIEKVLPVLSFEHEEIEVRLTAFDRHDLRHVVRSTPLGKPFERASISDVEAIVKQ
jgi:hypothetical protein